MVYDNDSTLFLGSRGGYGVIRFNIFNQGYEFLQTNNLRNPAIGDVLSVCQTEDSTFYAGASPVSPGLNSEGERCVYANSIKATGS